MNDNVRVPGVAWWILAGMLIPIVQAWLLQAFPDSPFLWVPLLVGLLGGLAKWIEWVLKRNNTAEPPPGAAAAPMQQTESRRGVAWWLF